MKFFESVTLLFALFVINSQSQQLSETQNGKATFMDRYTWPDGKQMAISLSFDDARFSQIDTGIPILNKYNVKATFYVSPDRFKQRIEEWKIVSNQGHEIGNHTMTHPCTGNYQFSRHNALEEYSLEMMAQEIDGANEIIKSLLGLQPTTFAYPCGQNYVGRGRNHSSYVPLVAERFIVGRGWLGEDGNNPAFCDLSNALGMELDGKYFDQVKSIIEKGATENQWIIFCGHEIGDTGAQTTLTQTLISICKYAADPVNGIWIDTVNNIGGYLLKQRHLDH
jgi:peptidoglycan-N-acetylglucosamine deacetylase